MPIGTRPFEFNRLEGQGYANPQASLISDTEWRDGTGDVNYVLHNSPAPTVSDIEVGDVFYTEDNNGLDSDKLYSGGSKWYTIRTEQDTSSLVAINIDNNGEVTAVNSTAPSDVLSVSGSIPYVNYYVRYDTNSQAIIGVDMYKTGSEDWHSIEGAVQVSNSSIGNSMSASNFNEFISASVAEYFDFSITGIITDSDNQISSSIQFQGYPKYEQSYIQSDGTECWTDQGQDSYLIKWSYDTDHNGGDKLVTLTGLAPDTTGNATYDGTYNWISDINYVGEGSIDHADELRYHIGYQWQDGALANNNIYIAHGNVADNVNLPGTAQILVNQDELISDFGSTSEFEIELFAWWYENKRYGQINLTVELWSGGTWTKSSNVFTNSGGTKEETFGPYELNCQRGNSMSPSGSNWIGFGDRTLLHTTNPYAYLKMASLTFADDSTGCLKVNFRNSIAY